MNLTLWANLHDCGNTYETTLEYSPRIMETISLLRAGLPFFFQLISGLGKPLTYLLIGLIELSLNLLVRTIKYLGYKKWRFRIFYKHWSVSWRRKFEHKFARQSLGLLILPLAFLILATSPDLINAQNSSLDLNSLTLSQEASSLIKTTESVRLPVEPLILTQGYLAGHSALDIKGQKGDPIHPMMKGKVIESIHGSSGYGNYVRVDHGSGLESLYAHMSKIKAYTGETVTTDSIIGEVGSTGRSTGNHLHFEIIDQGRKINPLTVIGGLKSK